jgi:hypothetical protein
MSDPNSGSERWAGVVIFAAILMFFSGATYLIVGISMLTDPSSLTITRPLIVELETWGWIYIVFGVLVIFAGMGLYRAATWARVVGSIVATASLLTAFASLSGNPWSIVVIALDVVILWALAIHGTALRVESRTKT